MCMEDRHAFFLLVFKMKSRRKRIIWTRSLEWNLSQYACSVWVFAGYSCTKRFAICSKHWQLVGDTSIRYHEFCVYDGGWLDI